MGQPRLVAKFVIGTQGDVGVAVQVKFLFGEAITTTLFVWASGACFRGGGTEKDLQTGEIGTATLRVVVIGVDGTGLDTWDLGTDKDLWEEEGIHETGLRQRTGETNVDR